ncbi:unnamed protein product [Calicophoron daubneyi]|uniref:DUF155 domain-containing protein n=1 Tax=Calicophoron daubneyi TaxID=300641 RepID=A0AAV2TRP4_CALDB
MCLAPKGLIQVTKVHWHYLPCPLEPWGAVFTVYLSRLLRQLSHSLRAADVLNTFTPIQQLRINSADVLQHSRNLSSFTSSQLIRSKSNSQRIGAHLSQSVSDTENIRKSWRATTSKRISSKESSLDFGVPLTTGQLGKKRTEKDAVGLNKAGYLEVSAYGIAQFIDLTALRYDFASKGGQYRPVSLPNDLSSDVLLVSADHQQRFESQQDVFIFRNGVIVLWNIAESEHSSFLSRIRKFCKELLTDPLVEREDLRYCFTNKATCLVGEDLFLQSNESRLSGGAKSTAEQIRTAMEQRNPHKFPEVSSSADDAVFVPVEDSRRLEQFAFSDALATSVKLSLLENSFDTVAIQMEPWIKDMKKGLRTTFPQSSVIKKTGELFTLKHLLNISTSMIETPDFYWDRPAVESLYVQLKNALSVSARTRILNCRLDMCCELTEILSNHLQSRHASRLEWMIIVLILVEVGFDSYSYFEKKQARLALSRRESSAENPP